MRVDCIIPLYNKKNFIQKALNSALNQKKLKFEKIIVINDGSTDNGDEVVKKLAVKNSSIKLLNQKNLGSSVARNNGIKFSKADFIVFLDADDQLHEKYLLCLNLMNHQHPQSKVYSSKHFNVFDNHQLLENSKDIKLFKSKIVKLDDPILKYSFNPKIFCSSGICIDRNLITNTPFPEKVNVGEDIYTWLKIFKNNHLVYYDKELIFIFKFSENRSIDIFKEIPFYLKKISELNNQKKKSFYIYFLISSIIYLYQQKDNSDIIQKFYEIIKKQSLLIFNILKLIDNNFFFQLYKSFKKRKETRENFQIKPEIDNLYIIAANYFFILPGIPLIVLCLYFDNKYSQISEVLLMSSITIFLTSSISFYARPFALIANKFRDTIKFIKIKKILIFPIIIIVFFFQFLLNLHSLFISNISILFILYLWRVEADIALIEFIGARKKLIFSLVKTISVTILLMLSIFIENNNLKIFIFILLLTELFRKSLNIFNYKVLIMSAKSFKNLINHNLIFISLNSFILNFTNFLWRFLMLIHIEKSFAGILFFAYSMGSFPANLFNFVFSPTILRSKKTFPNLAIYGFIAYFLIAIYLIYLDIFNIDSSIFYKIFDTNHLEFIYYSMIGGIIMSFALFNKNKIFDLNNAVKILIVPELIYSLIILSLVPIFYSNFELNSFKFIFLLNSIFAFLIFVPLNKLSR